MDGLRYKKFYFEKRMATVSGNTTSGYTITGTSEKETIWAYDYVSENSSSVTILGLDGDDVLSDVITKARVTTIYGGNGADLMSGSSYVGATFASFIIDGGFGADIFYLTGKSNGTPVFTRKATGTEIQYSGTDGAKFYAYVSDTVEIISWNDKSGNSQMYLTEDLSKGKQRSADWSEIKFRVNDRPDWYLFSRPDTYLEYQNYLAAQASAGISKYNTKDFLSGLAYTTPAPAATQSTAVGFNLDVFASTWSDKVKLNLIVRASDAGEKLEGKQIDYLNGEVAGSVITGGKGNDDIKGFAGWDILDGGDGNDLIHGGNGRDIITGGLGADQLWGISGGIHIHLKRMAHPI